jgi:hypothetical protein
MSSISALQSSDLNEFLFADVGAEPSGMMLSVVSLFARQGNDPWREAGRLAELPKDAATDSLTHDIAGMPQGRWSVADAAVIAGRLIRLLPVRPARTEAPFSFQASSWKPSVRNAVVMACVAIGIAFAFSAFMRPVLTGPASSDVTSFTAPASDGGSHTSVSGKE